MLRRALLAATIATPALAQAPWTPSRPIRLVAPYPPGGGVDTTSRLLAVPMGAFLGQSVVVENRGGAGGSIGAGEVARSAPDGQTILIDAMAHTVNQYLIRGLGFDYTTAFAPISQIVVLRLCALEIGAHFGVRRVGGEGRRDHVATRRRAGSPARSRTG